MMGLRIYTSRQRVLIYGTFSYSYLNKFITTLFIYNYRYELTPQDYWRLSFSATCSAIGAICSSSSAYYSSVQLAASPPATTSTGAFGKYDFIYARTWLGIDFAKCLTYVA
jgi:hypothetical protein